MEGVARQKNEDELGDAAFEVGGDCWIEMVGDEGGYAAEAFLVGSLLDYLSRGDFVGGGWCGGVREDGVGGCCY